MKIRNDKNNNKKNAKKALALSMMSGALCFAMLAGSTYAWFTDSASGSNIIATGNLDVELKHLKDGNPEKVDANTKLFLSAATVEGEDGTTVPAAIKWEPGAVAYETFVVENAGSLNLTFDFALGSQEAGVWYDIDDQGNQERDFLREHLKVAILPAVDADGNVVSEGEAEENATDAGEASEEESEEESPAAEVVDADGNVVSGEDDEDSEEDEEEEKKEKVIYYVTDEKQQSQYIQMFKAAKMDAVILTHNIDQPFISQLESKNEGIKFQRIDADLTDTFKAKTNKKTEKELEAAAEAVGKVMKKVLKKDNITIKVEKLKNKKISSMITLSEESRRMQDMMKMYAMPGMDMGGFGGEGETLILNANHPLVKYVTDNQEGENVDMICEQLYDLAKIQQSPLSPEAMTKFIARSNEIMMVLAK